MKKAGITFIILFLFFLGKSNISIKNKTNNADWFLDSTTNKEVSLVKSPIDSSKITDFFQKYPKLSQYKNQTFNTYQNQNYNYIWYDGKGIKEIATILYNKINNIQDEGLSLDIPYKTLFENQYSKKNNPKNIELELFLTTYYLLYAERVFHGIDSPISKKLGWYLPRNIPKYVSNIDSILVSPSKVEIKHLLPQYYKLREALKHYRDLEKKGDCSQITLDSKFTSLKPGDTSQIIKKIRTRLFIEGDLMKDSKINKYDEELKIGILNFKHRTGLKPELNILANHIAIMNIPISERIKTIEINMERCRWISNGLSSSREFIVINIPSYQLTFYKDKKPILVSNVVVGKVLNETVIFSGMMSSIVFCPYWNVPSSILKKEILPAIRRNKNYLSSHKMEWHDGGVRQKPGPNNSLGLIKFLFPNDNNIYLHDTPSKSLFKEENRAFSHGCIRLENPAELAKIILKKD